MWCAVFGAQSRISTFLHPKRTKKWYNAHLTEMGRKQIASMAMMALMLPMSGVGREPLPLDLDGNECPVTTFPAQTTAYDYTKLKREKLGRGLVAWRSAENTVTVGWRYLSSDPRDIAFDLYRDGEVVAEALDGSTQFDDTTADASTPHVYSLYADGALLATTTSHTTLGYVEIPLPAAPPNDTTGDGTEYSYAPGDCCVGDVDGDGEYEILLKWDPSIQGTGMGGFTGQHIYECLRLDGSSLWRIKMGVNICAGEHYANFCFADLDGDGKAEFATKTADGTIDGVGNVIGNPSADWRDAYGRVMTGPEYFTVFNGETGAAMATTQYHPARGTDLQEWRWGERGWGDDWGNRVDRFLFTPAYLDGEHLSVVACRGIYKRSALTAYDWDGKRLTTRWRFDTTNTTAVAVASDYQGQGFHSLRTGDVDGDGRDEIVYGAIAIDDEGSPLYTTHLGHGDAMHLVQADPFTRGMQVFVCLESSPYGCALYDAATGEIIWRKETFGDTGRCMTGDIDSDSPGFKFWSMKGGSSTDALGMYDVGGERLLDQSSLPSMCMAAWWNGSLERFLLSGTTLTSFSMATRRSSVVASFDGCLSNNSTKAVPCLQGDILGDWREEIVFRTDDNRSLRIYLSPNPTPYRFWTFLEDPVYRHSIANQHGCYNQPAHTGFYFGPLLTGHRIYFRGCYLE